MTPRTCVSGARRAGASITSASLCLVLGLGLMEIVALDRGQRADWFNSAWVWYFTAASAAAFIILIVHELRFSEPILDLRIMAIPAFDLSVIRVDRRDELRAVRHRPSSIRSSYKN